MGAVRIIRSENAGEEFLALFIILKEFFAEKLPWGITYIITVKDVLYIG